MPDLISLDPAVLSARLALDGLSKRQQVIANNLANVDTPGYQAQSYQFEEVIRQQMEKQNDDFALTTTNPMHISLSSQAAAPIYEARPGGSERADGNNVDINVEMTEMSETGIKYEALVQAAAKRLQLLKSIASER